MALRKVLGVHSAVREDIGDLVTYRALPTRGAGMERLEPFLFLNHHGPQSYPPHNEGLPFGPHPHRGFETVTFILKGSLLHEDSGGHKSVIRDGGIQWMTAGRGVVHAELSPEEFLLEGGPLEILQLWLNLPASLKLTPPRYVGLQADQLPAHRFDDGKGTLRPVSGHWDNVDAPIHPLTDVHLASVSLNTAGKFARSIPEGQRVFLYVVRGRARVNGSETRARQVVELATEGSEVEVEALEPALFLFGHATPQREPIAAYGPFVMNTRSEIEQAISDFQSGKFGS